MRSLVPLARGIVVFFASLSPHLAGAQEQPDRLILGALPEGGDLVGQIVMAVEDGAEIRDDEQVVAKATMAQYFIVAQVEGDRLLIVRGDVAGWIARSAVLPLAEAVAHFTKLVSEDPSAEHFAYRGLAYVAMDDHASAAEDFTSAIELAPMEPRYFLYRSDVRAERGDYEAAIVDLDRAIELNALAPEYFDARGDLWRELGEHERSVHDYSEILRIDPNYVTALLDRALAYSSLKRHDQALADMDQYIDVEPEDAVAYYYRGLVHQARGADREAIADYARAVELDHKQPAFANGLAWILATSPSDELRDGERAVEWATAACKAFEWTNVESLDTLAAAYAETGEFDRAIEMQEKAIALGPAGQPDLLARLELYRSGKPFRAEPPR